jgi:hypothetical protein
VKRRKRNNLNTRSMRAAWWAPLIDAERERAWEATRERIHAAIQRARFAGGYEDATASALGDHLYTAANRPSMRRAS